MIRIGIKGHGTSIVDESNIASTVGSGTVDVFATPMMIALVEKTASLSIQPYLEQGQSSVGTSVNMTHLSATPIGMKVWADTEVTEVDRRRIVFNVKTFDECGLIGEGTHERFIVDVEKFRERAYTKKKEPKY